MHLFGVAAAVPGSGSSDAAATANVGHGSAPPRAPSSSPLSSPSPAPAAGVAAAAAAMATPPSSLDGTPNGGTIGGGGAGLGGAGVEAGAGWPGQSEQTVWTATRLDNGGAVAGEEAGGGGGGRGGGRHGVKKGGFSCCFCLQVCVWLCVFRGVTHDHVVRGRWVILCRVTIFGECSSYNSAGAVNSRSSAS